MARAILFDFNGVLLDDESVHFELFQQVLAEEGIALDEREYYQDYVGFDDRAGFEYALERAGREADGMQLARLCARKAAYYQERMKRDSYPFFPGAIDFVKHAADAGLTLGIVSGALRSEIDQALRHVDLEQPFKSIVAAEDVDESKPSPAGYRLGVQQLNSRPPLPERLIHPHEVVAIEDTVHGLEAASAAGLQTVALAHTYSTRELERHADVVVAGFIELSVESLLGESSEVDR